MHRAWPLGWSGLGLKVRTKRNVLVLLGFHWFPLVSGGAWFSWNKKDGLSRSFC